MDIKRIFVENGSMQSAGSGALSGEDTSQGGSPAGVFTDRNCTAVVGRLTNNNFEMILVTKQVNEL